MDGEAQLAPGFISPPNSDYVGYHQYIDDYLPEETPYLYGLHPNAEIGYLTTVSERLFKASTIVYTNKLINKRTVCIFFMIYTFRTVNTISPDVK